MRILLTLFLLNLNYILANDAENRIIEIGQILPSEDKIGGCKTSIFEKQKRASCSMKKDKKDKKVAIAPIKISVKRDKKITEIEAQLHIMREEFKRYKEHKEREKEKISTQLKTIKKEFVLYKRSRDKKIQKIQTKLINTQKKLASIQKSIKKRSHKKRESSKKRESNKKRKSRVIKKELEKMPIVKNIPWVEVVVEDGLDIYQLALKYYKDKKEYKQIFVANRDIIGRDLKIRDGMSLKIPMTDKFEEQPLFLNRY